MSQWRDTMNREAAAARPSALIAWKAEKQASYERFLLDRISPAVYESNEDYYRKWTLRLREIAELEAAK